MNSKRAPKEVKTLCEHCSTEFEIRMEHNACLSQSISNFDDCPKCGTRNDTWLAINWQGAAETFQPRVDQWMAKCFGREISADVTERNHRFLEEALELVQSKGCTASEAHQLVDYVFNRPIGEPDQEVGGVRVTLAALCTAAGLDENECAETELNRIWTKIPEISAKQAAKPKHSPLPQES